MPYTTAPILETDRLKLRPYRYEDFEGFAALYQSPRSKYMDGPIERNTAWTLFAAGAAHWQLLGHGPWSIERKDDTQCVGLVSLNPPIAAPEQELGWALWEGYTGKGYALEAAICARDFALQTLNWASFVSYISAPNTPSIKLAKHLGATLDPEATSKQTGDTQVYRYTS